MERLVAQWRAVAPSSEMAFESAYAAAVRGFERDISRLLREKRQFKMLKRFLSYTREFGRLSRQSQELEFLTRGLIPEQPCHPAVYATLMNHWVRNLDPLAQVRLLPLRSETPEVPEDQESQYVLEIERSFGMAWVVDGQIPEADAELLLKRVLGSPAQNLTPLQWVWDLSRGQPSPELLRMLIDGLRGRRMVSWIWGDASELGPWKREWGTYYEATKVCELKSAQVSVVAACEPTRASRLEGQDPEQDLWLAVLSRERARRLDLTH